MDNIRIKRWWWWFLTRRAGTVLGRIFRRGYPDWGAHRGKPAVSRRADPRSSRHEGSRGEARLANIIITMLGNYHITAAVRIVVPGTQQMYKYNERVVSAARPLSGSTTGQRVETYGLPGFTIL